MRSALLGAAAAALLIAGPAAAHSPKGGLGGVAVSPDGKTVVCGGDSRVLYVLDAETLEVKKRVWLRTDVWQLRFNADGSRLLLEDTQETIHFLDTRSWEPTQRTIERAGFMSLAPGANALSGVVSRSSKKSVVAVFSSDDGSEVLRVDVPGQALAQGLSSDGKVLHVLVQADGAGEEKLPASKTPKGLQGLERAEFQQRHDGFGSVLYRFEVPTGKTLAQSELYYKPAGEALLVASGGAVHVIAYGNVNAKVTDNGEVFLWQGESSYNYGMGVSADRKVVLLGGLRKGSRIGLDGSATSTFEVPALPGWPEYYKEFALAADGTGYGVTTAYRLVKIDKEGKLAKVVPVF